MTEMMTARVLIDGKTITRKDFESAADDVIRELKETGNVEGVNNALVTLNGLGQFSVFLSCKVLYGYSSWWKDTNQDEIRGDNFFDYITSLQLHGLANPLTIERYINLWEHYERGTLLEEIKNRPLSEQIAIVAVVEDDRYHINDDDWEELVDAANGTEIRRILRKIKGKEPTKGSYVLHLGRDGELYVWHQGQRVYWGQVKLPNGTTDPIEKRVIEKMCNRLKNGSMSPIVD
ncbi:hypothetical protein HN960_05380 [Candidatus Peregrinibacteria bacterium]|jgi:hypothetical protein|nr:hypothetical protein [Candidatus Peregrinibacteria bacterium]